MFACRSLTAAEFALPLFLPALNRQAGRKTFTSLLEKPHSKMIRDTSLERTMEEFFQAGFAVDEVRQHNQAVLKKLKRRQEWLQFLCYFLVFGGAAGFTLFSPSLLVALPPIAALLGRLQTTSQRVILIEQLIESFQEEGVKIHSGISLEDAREIDIFVSFPEKEFLLIQNRSLGNSKVFYNERIEALQFLRKGGGLKTWEPDPLVELAIQEKTLRKSRRDLFGGSSKDQRKPLSKLLVLWGETKLGDHSKQMYETMGGFLSIRKIGTANLVEHGQVINFVRAYRAYRRSQKAL